MVGRNCKRIRSQADVTMNVLAMHARRAGLRWNTGKVGQFERGQYSPAFATILAVTAALSKATGAAVTLADLVASDGFVAVTDQLTPSGDALLSILRGDKGWGDLVVDDVALPPGDVGEVVERGLWNLSRTLKKYRGRDVPTAAVYEIGRRSGLDEDRLAKRLGIGPDELAIQSYLLWRRSFSDERDERAGADANAQKRGRISRTLQAELERALADGDD